MKALLFLAALLPLSVLAQPLNTTNNPNQPGYVIPSQQRMQNQMQVQQQHLQTQLNNNQQRVIQSGNLNSSQQMLPNNNGGMLQRQTTP